VTGLPKKRHGNGHTDNEERINILIHFRLRISGYFFTPKQEIKNDQPNNNIKGHESHTETLAPPPTPCVNII
jgi:hypothetical protein